MNHKFPELPQDYEAQRQIHAAVDAAYVHVLSLLDNLPPSNELVAAKNHLGLSRQMAERAIK